MELLNNYFKALFPKAPSDEDIKLRRKRATDTILSRYSEGNINLSNGKYISEASAKELKKKVSAYNFN